MHTSVCCNTIYNSRDMEATQMSLREIKQGLGDNLKGWDGEGDGREVWEGGDMGVLIADSYWEGGDMGVLMADSYWENKIL